MNGKKLTALLVATAAAVSLAACGEKDTVVSDMEKGEISYPIETTEKVSWWMSLPSPLATTVSNFGETDFAKYLKEATGIEVEYIHPAQGSDDAISLLLASDELPDIITTYWPDRSPDSSIEDGLILDITSYIDDYAPNFKKFTDENDEVRRAVLTDDGVYYGFPFVRNDPTLLATKGLFMRADWLEELGLEVPETIDDWDKVLAAFKTKCDTPIAISYNDISVFAGGFNAIKGMYHDADGKIKYGTIEDNYKNYIAKMNEWYKKGYFDKNYAIADKKTIDSYMLTGTSGITDGAGGSAMGTYLSAKAGEGGYDLVAAKFPVAKKGERSMYSHNSAMVPSVYTAAISADCKNPALAMRLLDFGYSEEGKLLYNFGKEGVSYTMKDGYPTYSPSLFDTSGGKSIAQNMAMHCLGIDGGAFVQDKRYIEQYYGNQRQLDALDAWAENDFAKYAVRYLSLTKDESSEYSSIINSVQTYLDEMINNMIVGKESIDNFDKYVAQAKSMGLDRAIEIYQTAYDRYLKR